MLEFGGELCTNDTTETIGGSESRQVGMTTLSTTPAQSLKCTRPEIMLLFVP